MIYVHPVTFMVQKEAAQRARRPVRFELRLTSPEQPFLRDAVAASSDPEAIAAAARLLAAPGDTVWITARERFACATRHFVNIEPRNITWRVLFRAEAAEIALQFMRGTGRVY